VQPARHQCHACSLLRNEGEGLWPVEEARVKLASSGLHHDFKKPSAARVARNKLKMDSSDCVSSTAFCGNPLPLISKGALVKKAHPFQCCQLQRKTPPTDKLWASDNRASARENSVSSITFSLKSYVAGVSLSRNIQHSIYRLKKITSYSFLTNVRPLQKEKSN